MRQGRFNPALLQYRPPTQSEPETVEPGTSGFFSKEFGESTDGIVKLPATARTGQTEIKKGRHLRIVGGQLNSPGTGNSILRYSNVAGSIFNEGVLFKGEGANVDAVDGAGTINSPYVNQPDVYFQNCRVEGIRGVEESVVHADMYQPQAAMGYLYIDKFTGYSQYQGFFLQPESRPRRGVHLSRMNLGYEEIEGSSSPTYLLWFFGEESTPYDVYIGEQVYITPRPGETLAKHCVWPKEGVKNTEGELIGAYSEDGGASIEFHSPRIHGKILRGPPPGGDFVPASSCGAGYVSPGYL